MISRIAVVLGVLTAICSAADVNVVNNCKEQIDPGFFPPVNYGEGTTGGFVLQSDQNATVELPFGWYGRIWPRTGCNDEGQCDTGSCQGGIDCTDPSPAGPTLAQFNIGPGNKDYFNPSTVDGFNVPVIIIPGPGCSTRPVGCIGPGEGNGCEVTSECPTGVNYTVVFCT
ncbi:Osmotin thaumatin-like protein [Fomitopsis schrenkii]|uniref:Osmotin thaumatin-like protein n=1 Tax=Fomitopsis schrenkii TaxID=2126942 RepID=S8FD27_FOMSC|nr:Osmotin thaumatin-like protein [Fomitopsis schrenkii]